MASRILIQAPMAGAQGWELAAAVHKAGGLGSIPCAMLSKEQILKECQEFARATSQSSISSPPKIGNSKLVLNLNFFCHQVVRERDLKKEEKFKNQLEKFYRELDIKEVSPPAFRHPFGDDHLALLEQINPSHVSFHFGLPKDEHVEKIKKLGIKILCSATTREEAVYLESKGCDEIIAQGVEAGGHRGMFLPSSSIPDQLGLIALLPQIVNSVKVPVIAAGGIFNAETCRACQLLGASKIQIGTAFLLTKESRISKIYRQTLRESKNKTTVLTNVFTGKPARAIRNKFVDEIGPINPNTVGFPNTNDFTFSLKSKAESLGRNDFSNCWAGQNFVFLEQEEVTVQAICDRILALWDHGGGHQSRL